MFSAIVFRNEIETPSYAILGCGGPRRQVGMTNYGFGRFRDGIHNVGEKRKEKERKGSGYGTDMARGKQAGRRTNKVAMWRSDATSVAYTTVTPAQPDCTFQMYSRKL